MYIQSTICAPSRREVSDSVRQFGPIRLERDLTVRGDHFAKDQQIFLQGERADNVYSVVGGAVRSSKLLRDGRCQIIAFHLPNDLFGFDFSDTHTVTVEAIAKTDVIVASRRELVRQATAHADVAEQFWRLTARQLDRADNYLLSLGRRTATERVAAFLIEMDDRIGGKEILPLPMSRTDIGDHLGLTIETVSRTLNALHSKGIIEAAGTRDIVLRDRKRLQGLIH
jgi:CRP/FNR family nitrogen fixation transcriptional regulator